MKELQRQIDLSADQITAIESFVEDLLPMLIAGSSNRAQIEAWLVHWEQQETGEDRVHHHTAELASAVMDKLRSL